MVLYIFEVVGTGFVKMGHTGGCPWRRISDGFWKLVHPTACCRRLGFDDLQLLHLSPGDLEDEGRVQKLLPPARGEFWPVEQLPELRRCLMAVAIDKHRCSAENWQLPLPPRPAAPPVGRGVEKHECCGGVLLPCYGCTKLFKLWIRLQTHKQESCPASAGQRPACGFCGRRVISRLMKRHHQSLSCRAARGTE